MARSFGDGYLGSSQSPRKAGHLTFVRPEGYPATAEQSPLRFTSVPMPAAHSKKGRIKPAPTPESVADHRWHRSCATSGEHAFETSSNWAQEELLHDIALSGDGCLTQVFTTPRTEAEPSSPPVNSPAGRYKSCATRSQLIRDPGGALLEPWADAHLLDCLRGTPLHNVHPDIVERQRVAGRISAYQMETDTDNVERLFRKVLDGTRREVPPPRKRLDLIRSVHTQAMHLGVRRTQQLVMRQWYWNQLRQDVRLVVSSCEECARRNLAFTADDPELHCLPIYYGALLPLVFRSVQNA